ncbi:MAG: malate synthase A [Candidatus Sericytochromatia bacterium]|nr:malate synthase A [Candidatus Tanganyikabacteria bacterium]
MTVEVATARPAQLARGCPRGPGCERLLTPEAMAFLGKLHAAFETRRRDLLEARALRQRRLDAGELPDFLPQTRLLREGEWRVADAPPDLQRRTVEITGPVERKMMINALNSGADCFMADFEDANSPTWDNVVAGQINCQDAVRRTLSFESADGREYRLADRVATLMVRPRGWHLVEKHVVVDDEVVSGSLFDFGLYFFHNARELLARGSGPYFYLPKLESHHEARLWNDVFDFAQDELGIPRGTIRATVLIETILAALEMEEILFELREHSAGLNAGRWDYIFSCIKKFRNRPGLVFPDRAAITMTVPFMRAYTDLLVRTCHKRGAHAIGGMAAFIPSRKDAAVNSTALGKVREDKDREAGDAFDGTWVAHPDLVAVAGESFRRLLGDRPHQIARRREDVSVAAGDLLAFEIAGGQVTEAGVRKNVNVALQYLDSWLRGIGAAAIHNLMEDAATAEISRAQLWQWLHGGARLGSGETVDETLYRRIRGEELAALGGAATGRLAEAARLLDGLVLSGEFAEFLTVSAYASLD